MAATFLLIRHAAHIHLDGTLTGRMSGVPLSDAGRAQAMRLAERLAGEPIAHVLTSPRERARETAAAIAARHALTPEVAHGVDEIDFGAWTGKRFAELDGDPLWQRWNERRGEAAPPDGEPATAAQRRAWAFLRDEAIDKDGRTVAVVTHADIIRSVICQLVGIPLDSLLRFDCDAASVTRIFIAPHGNRLISLNERTA